jgi:acyl-CoA thioesterase-1
MDLLSRNGPRPQRSPTRTHNLHHLLFCGILALLLAACGGGATSPRQVSHAPAPRPTRTPTQASGTAFFSRPITYVALGASDAVGVGSKTPGTQGYVPLIAAHLPDGSRTLNLGVDGILLHDALSRELPRALSASPQLITIWLVANDFAGGVSYQSYISDLNSLLDQLHTKTQARIVMANLPDLTRLPVLHSFTSTQKAQILQAVKQWDQGIARAAARYKVTLVNLLQDGNELTAHPEYISSDGFHPSAQGYARLASLFWKAIQTA